MDIGQIQDVTDSLALMPDAALQKYAMMNKDDPYIMSLAMSENNRRQKLRTAQQGQAGQVPAPKVVDQAIASINPPPAPPPQPMPPQQAQQPMPPQQAMPQAQTQLPEDQGIAQLPAPNMQGMADGGIVGYAVGGVPTPSEFGKFLRTQGVSPPDFSRLPSAAQETLKRLFSNATAGPQMATATPTPIPPAPAVAAAAAEQPGLAYRMGQSVAQGVKRVGDFISKGSPRLGVGLAALLTPGNANQDTREEEMLAAMRGEGYKGKPYNKEEAAALLKEMGLDPARVPAKAAPAVKPAALPSQTADQGRGKSGGPSEKELIEEGIAAAPSQKKGSGAAPQKTKADVAPTSGGNAGTGGGLPTLVASPATTPANTPADAAAELSAIKASQKPEVPAEIRSALEDAGAARRASLDAEETQRQQDLAAMGTAFSDREARLKAKQERVDKQEKDLTPMAIIQAGFSMMSGTSPHAMANIGAGATIGLKTYQEGLEKIENAKDKLDDAFGRIEEFRRSESMMNAKDKRKYVRELSDTFADTKKALVDVYVKDWGVKQDDARTIFSAVVADRREAANRAFQAGESAAQRSFLGGENAAQRSFTAGENAANRESALANTRLQASLRPPTVDPLAIYKELADPTSRVAKGYGVMKEENIVPTLFAQYEKNASDDSPSMGGKYATKGDEWKARHPSARAYVDSFRSSLGQGTMPQAGGSGFTIVGSRPAK